MQQKSMIPVLSPPWGVPPVKAKIISSQWCHTGNIGHGGEWHIYKNRRVLAFGLGADTSNSLSTAASEHLVVCPRRDMILLKSMVTVV